MNLSLSDRSVHTASKGRLEEEKAEIRHSCFRRTTHGNPSVAACPSGSLISQLLRKTIQSKRALDETLFYLPAVGVLSSYAQEDQNSNSSKSSVPDPTSPGAHTSSSPSAVAGSEGEWPLNEHHRAKRARVENIIRGMAGSPQGRLPEEEERSQEEARDCRENKRKQRLPQHQDHGPNGDLPASRGSSSSKDEECHRLREQLQAMQRLLRQLQEKFFQVHSASEQVNREETAPSGPAERNDVAGNAEGSERELPVDYDDELESGPGGNEAGQRETRKMDSDQVTFLAEGKNLPEALKQELSRAVSESVDLVFKRFSSALLKQPGRLQMSQTPEALRKKTRTPNGGGPPQGEDAAKPQYYQGAEPPEPGDQTEALSLVVRKQPLSHPSSVIQAVNRPYALHQAPFQFGYGTSLHESQILEHLLKYGPHSNFTGLPCVPPALERSSPDSVDLPWDAVMARSKVSSSAHMGHHARPTALGQVMVDGLGLPGVKMECGELQGMVDRNPYLSLNEGLTPNHLKKAKLMFFYSRYPSSNVLKTFFPDVKFNRCVTSQLIKWFSNFREFYYIQMEKFARQAVMDGVDNAKDLSVTRGSELFRALNMHYNKANDFQVPERFLEVAEITLQEFFNAISLAKDSDPSWKKAIYKIICKLDSEVPEEFKISACL